MEFSENEKKALKKAISCELYVIADRIVECENEIKELENDRLLINAVRKKLETT